MGYEICMYLQFVPGDNPDSFYPGEDKLWFEILLDYWHNRTFVDTIDCNGFELPLEFMEYSAEKRESMRGELMDRAAASIAEMLERNNVDEYTLFGNRHVDLMRIEPF